MSPGQSVKFLKDGFFRKMKGSSLAFPYKRWTHSCFRMAQNKIKIKSEQYKTANLVERGMSEAKSDDEKVAIFNVTSISNKVG